MQDSSRSVGNESNDNGAATFGLDSLKLGDEILKVSAPHMPGKGSEDINKMSKMRQDGPSKINSRSWRREQQVPVYEPLNVPPLGSGQSRSSELEGDLNAKLHYTMIRPTSPSQPTAAHTQKGLIASGRAPTSSSLDQHGKQYSIGQARHGVPTGQQTIDYCANDNESKQHSSVQARIGALPPPPQPLGRWFGSAPGLQQKSRPPNVRSPTPVHAVKLPPTPTPNPAYIALSAIPAMLLPFPQPLLVVLDLNGTLLYRPVGSSHHRPRPSLQLFLTHCLANYSLLIWSSATPHNVTTICSRIFTPVERKLLLGEWARDTLGLTSQQYAAKVQVFKRLDRIWNHDGIQHAHPDYVSGGRWSQENTLLLDDSARKASAQPYNAVVVPEFAKEDSMAKQKEGPDVLGQVVSYLETARMYNDVSSFVRMRPFKVNDGWACAWPQKETGKQTASSSARTSRQSRRVGRNRGSAVIDLTAESDEETGGVAL
ncbi:MAG: hypothetical protein Q9208_002081 [Pyrenodesmia sp. 3 TL-2023]